MKNLLLLSFFCLSLNLSAQNVGVGTTAPDPSAKLEIKASNAGILIPRVNIVSATDAITILSPATGLMIWNTGVNFGTAGFYYNTGTSAAPNWVKVLDSSSTVNDADSDPTNEFNTNVTLSGTTLNVIDGGGTNSVNLSSLVNDADAVIGNEYNTGATLTGTTLNIVDGGGTNTVNLSSLVKDADAVIGNEYNTGATLTGTTLNIVDGGGTKSVNLSSLATGDNLGNHTATTTLNMATNSINNVTNLSVVPVSSYDKLRVWNSGSYTIGMNSAMTYGYLNDYAMTFTMNADTDRGFLWRDINDAKSDGAMSLTTDGRLTVKSTARFQDLAGSGTRNVVADANGVLNVETATSSFYEVGSRNASYASGQISWCQTSTSNNGGPSNTRTTTVLTVTNNSSSTKIFRVYAVVAAKADNNTDDFEHWIDDGPSGGQYYDKQETRVYPWGGSNTGTNTRYTHLENEYYYTIGAGSSRTFRHRARMKAGGCGIIKNSGYMVVYPVN